MKQHLNNTYGKELMQSIFHTKNINKWSGWGFGWGFEIN